MRTLGGQAARGQAGVTTGLLEPRSRVLFCRHF